MEVLNEEIGAKSWSEVVGLGCESSSLGEESTLGWERIVGKRKIPVPGKAKVEIDTKSFFLERSKLDRLNSVIINERKKDFQTYIEVDHEGVAWMALLMKNEASSSFKGLEKWSFNSKLGSLLEVRDRNGGGEFMKFTWSKGSRSFRPIFIPLGRGGEGWGKMAETLLNLIADFKYKSKPNPPRGALNDE